MMAQRVIVFDVIMNEREVVNQFDSDRRWKNLLELIGRLPSRNSSRLGGQAGLMRQEEQRRAQEFAEIFSWIPFHWAEVCVCPAQVIAHIVIEIKAGRCSRRQGAGFLQRLAHLCQYFSLIACQRYLNSWCHWYNTQQHGRSPPVLLLLNFRKDIQGCR